MCWVHLGEVTGDICSAEPVIDVGHLLAQGDSCLIILILLIVCNAVRTMFWSTKDQHFLLGRLAHVIPRDVKAFYAGQQLWFRLQYGLLTTRKCYVQLIIDNLEGAVAFLDRDKAHLRC